jgi:hypothetical protein
MGFFDTITNIFFGTERVKASKAECKAKKDKAKTDYDAVMKQIEAECEANLIKAKEADKATQPQPPATAPEVTQSTRPAEATDNRFFSTNKDNPPSAAEPNRIGGKKGGKSKKRSKSNRKRTRKH